MLYESWKLATSGKPSTWLPLGRLVEQACLFVRLLEENRHFLYMQEKQVVHRDLLRTIGSAPSALTETPLCMWQAHIRIYKCALVPSDSDRGISRYSRLKVVHTEKCSGPRRRPTTLRGYYSSSLSLTVLALRVIHLSRL